MINFYLTIWHRLNNTLSAYKLWLEIIVDEKTQNNMKGLKFHDGNGTR
jgi:hypothetical protein